MNLYEISDKYLSILNHFEEQEGEIGQNDIEKLKELDKLSDNINDKAVNIAAYIKNIEAEYDQVSKARKDMQSREKRLENKAEWLKDYLKLNLQKLGVNEITSSPNFVIRVKSCPCSVNIIDELKIDAAYKNVKEVVTVDKNKLKEALKAGIVVQGAELQQNVRLEIK